MTVDYLFYNAIVVTMADKAGCGIIEDGAVAVTKSTITEVGTSCELLKKYKAHCSRDVNRNVIMPGLIDAHMHTRASLYKGLAQDTCNWLSSCSLPYKAALDEASGRAGSLVMIAEALKAGTTTFVDINEDMDTLAQNHIKAGTRAIIGSTVTALDKKAALMQADAPYELNSSVENDTFKKGIALTESYHSQCGGRIECLLSPIGPDRVSAVMLREIRNYSEKHNIPVHMHLACGERETKQMQMRYKMRSIPFLFELGLINSRLTGIHLSVASKSELKAYAKAGAAMVLCSGSEAIVDGNIPPAYEFSNYSSRLALGTDQTSGGNTSNMFFEMKLGALLNKCKANNPEVFQAWKMLRMATVDGAAALGIADKTGSLQSGKKADLIIVDMHRLHLTPVLTTPIRNIISNLVYAVNGSEILLSMIDGKLVIDEGRLITLDEKEVIEKANEEGVKLLQRMDKEFFTKDTTINRLMQQNKM